MKFKNIDIRWLGHSGFLIEAESLKTYIDPFKIDIDEPADIILITHPHYDHCSIEDLRKIVKSGTIIVCPADVQSKISKLDNEIELKILGVGETLSLGEIKIGAIPAYNLNKEFHRKSEEWLGYVLKIEDKVKSGVVIYHAGDTDLIPEMKKLSGKVDIALLPVSGTYTMNSEEAAEAASVINPDIAVPIHYGNNIGSVRDAENFVELCREKGIRAEILEKE